MNINPDLVRKCISLYKHAYALLTMIDAEVAEFCERNNIVPICREDAFKPVDDAEYVERKFGIKCLMAYRAYVPKHGGVEAKAIGYVVIRPDGGLEFIEEVR